MEAQSLATLLLALRILAVVLLVAAVLKQVHLIRYTTTKWPGVRIGIFIATLVLLLGQVIPIALDTIIAFGHTYQGRNLNPELLNKAYSLNNAVKDVVIGGLLAIQYYRPRNDKKVD